MQRQNVDFDNFALQANDLVMGFSNCVYNLYSVVQVLIDVPAVSKV